MKIPGVLRGGGGGLGKSFTFIPTTLLPARQIPARTTFPMSMSRQRLVGARRRTSLILSQRAECRRGLHGSFRVRIPGRASRGNANARKSRQPWSARRGTPSSHSPRRMPGGTTLISRLRVRVPVPCKRNSSTGRAGENVSPPPCRRPSLPARPRFSAANARWNYMSIPHEVAGSSPAGSISTGP